MFFDELESFEKMLSKSLYVTSQPATWHADLGRAKVTKYCSTVIISLKIILRKPFKAIILDRQSFIENTSDLSSNYVALVVIVIHPDGVSCFKIWL